MPNDNVNNRDIVLHYRDGSLQRISELHRGYHHCSADYSNSWCLWIIEFERCNEYVKSQNIPIL